MYKKVTEINKNFYNREAKNFSDTRKHAWAGWSKITEEINKTKKRGTINILDLGCGNGRFLDFLIENNIKAKYEGWDSSKEMLKQAIKKHKNIKNATFIEKDITKKNKINKKYQVIVLFGVAHHLKKRELLKALKYYQKYLECEGILVISFWQIYKFQRFNKLKVKKINNSSFLLKWQDTKSLRFYRAYKEKDIEEIKKALETLKAIKEFNADGKEKKLNRYIIFKKTCDKM